ncbi:MAG: hypothetical protein AAGU11_13215, partial [Syntrophobacteraceae bacterium]
WVVESSPVTPSAPLDFLGQSHWVLLLLPRSKSQNRTPNASPAEKGNIPPPGASVPEQPFLLSPAQTFSAYQLVNDTERNVATCFLITPDNFPLSTCIVLLY